MEHNQGILRNAKASWCLTEQSNCWAVQFIDDRQLFQALLLRHSLGVMYVLVSLKAAHYSTHFQVHLQLLLLILGVCESLQKTKSEAETIHKGGWVRTSLQSGTGLQGPV